MLHAHPAATNRCTGGGGGGGGKCSGRGDDGRPPLHHHLRSVSIVKELSD